MTKEEAVKKFLTTIQTAYIEDQRAKGIVASGQSARSLKIEISPASGSLLGSSYFHYQKVGRRPGGFPPIEAIIQWLKDKSTFNVAEERGPGLRGLAFLIARKIAKKGTDIYQGKRPGLSVEEKILEARKELVNDVAGIEREKITEGLQKVRA